MECLAVLAGLVGFALLLQWAADWVLPKMVDKPISDYLKAQEEKAERRRKRRDGRGGTK